MSDKRANNGVWRIGLDENQSPDMRRTSIISRYQKRSKADPDHAPLVEIQLEQRFENVALNLYIRTRTGSGFHPFIADYLVNDGDRQRFFFKAVDICLFIATTSSLYAVTTGSGYHIIEDEVDYSFPFDVARRLVANNFKAAETRQFTGATTSRIETYRRGQSIASSESFGKVWKRLAGRLNSDLLPKESYLRRLIDPSRPPVVEVKSSFVLRKSLNLRQLVGLVQEIETLPEASEEQRKELSFLDNLYQVKSKSLITELKSEFVERLRRAVQSREEFDLDVCDPDDVTRYYAGSDFKLSYWPLEGDPPDADDLFKVLQAKYPEELKDSEKFLKKIDSATLRYSADADDETQVVSKDLYKFMHGQVEHEGQVYFLLDKSWYRVQGDFLANLKRDFIHEVFESVDPIYMETGATFLTWDVADEDAFNTRQAKEDGFYYGDKIFASSNRGKVELFDLLRVDEAKQTLYVIHVKDGFDAKMRDACSQISISAEVIRQDLSTDMSILKAYYSDWKSHELNASKDVDEDQFLKWFKLSSIVYVVLASTASKFLADSFRRDIFKSHIARREIIATRNDLASHRDVFRLAHTKRIKVRKPSS